MTDIIPAIIPKNFDDLRDSVAQVSDFVSFVQIDIVDGVYVSTKGWPYVDSQTDITEDTAVLHLMGISFGVDLMVSDPESVVLEWVDAGASRIIVHIENTENMSGIIRKIKKADSKVEIGIAINTTTEISLLEEYITDIDFVQCMGIREIGSQGQPFDERVLTQVASIKKQYPDMIISIDGGVTLSTAPQLVDFGATRLVSGSAILRSSDIAKTIAEFKKIS